MSGRLKGLSALVFGAGSSGPGWGNGKATAVAFAREGARIAAVDINGQAAEETAHLIEKEGFEAVAICADVTNPEQVENAVNRAQHNFGRIDILQNNVGIGTFGGPVELSLEEWTRVMNVNVTGAFLACKFTLPLMFAQGSGAIVNTSSIAGVGIGRFRFAAYSTSKAALNHLTRAVAVEYADKGIRSNAIMPGIIDTPMVNESSDMVAQYGSIEELKKARDAQSPTGRAGEPWDVAAAAVFLASNEAKYINGAILPVDGGLSCRMG